MTSGSFVVPSEYIMGQPEFNDYNDAIDVLFFGQRPTGKDYASDEVFFAEVMPELSSRGGWWYIIIKKSVTEYTFHVYRLDNGVPYDEIATGESVAQAGCRAIIGILDIVPVFSFDVLQLAAEKKKSVGFARRTR